MGPRPRETRLAVDDGMNGLAVLERGRARRGTGNPERRRAGDRAEIAALRRRRMMPWARGGRWRGGRARHGWRAVRVGRMPGVRVQRGHVRHHDRLPGRERRDHDGRDGCLQQAGGTQ
jgi:hypothetical protein